MQSFSKQAFVPAQRNSARLSISVSQVTVSTESCCSGTKRSGCRLTHELGGPPPPPLPVLGLACDCCQRAAAATPSRSASEEFTALCFRCLLLSFDAPPLFEEAAAPAFAIQFVQRGGIIRASRSCRETCVFVFRSPSSAAISGKRKN